MLELYQFELSHYCEKVRLILDYKGLPYRKVEVTPGIGQLDLYRLSGQRQVPVLKDGAEVIADSTAIAKYLDQHYPERPIIPTDPKQRALCFVMEEWADESIGLNARKVMIGAFSQSAAFRRAFLPSSTPDFLRTVVDSVPPEALEVLGMGAGFGPDAVKAARQTMQQNLESLCVLLQDSSYLLGEEPTLADFAVAALTMYVKFPAGAYLKLPEALKGMGVPGLADNPAYDLFWVWRDRLYATYRKVGIPGESTATSGTGPTSINIE
ncbi:glutathione S-transferase family protein [Leptolyngbya sp. NK1-12]|uniref:Glutathione S-transferase family protein n=1 Tax=Leptolyngbya sp. NK1-12 TaxID=2547451 RepID=A0AA96WLX7_9CYAN|nr:glutathione S-transferase family protein [Leptolyngbya sp. NK1-12]WNZ23771.1 glutathione S-transferase family protein [Leptolyngbya sp. NK1-12]